MSAPMTTFGRVMSFSTISVKLRQLCKRSFNAFNAKYGRSVFIKLKNTLSFRNEGLPPRLLFLQAFVTVQALGFSKNKKNTEEEATAAGQIQSQDQLIIERADILYSDSETNKLYDHLSQYKDSENDEILWRLARAATDKGKASSSAEEKKSHIYEAFGYIQKALEINKTNFACHKWYAILLDYTGEYEGTKKRISNAYLVKEHFMKAIELNPKDATSIYSLGYWCFLFADMPWYTKKIAAALFATPPSSTYDEALKYFQQAEEVDPNFYSMNLLMLGKTHVRLKNKRLALLYLTRARDYPVKTPDDQQAHKEAIELLHSIGVKSEE